MQKFGLFIIRDTYKPRRALTCSPQRSKRQSPAMSKAGGGPGSAPGPTAAAAAAAVQKQKSLLQKADADVSSLVDNFSSLINIARVRPCALLSPLESGGLKHSGLTLARNAMVRSTIRLCATRRRPSRWRRAPPAWYGPARCPPTVSGFDSETVSESGIPC